MAERKYLDYSGLSKLWQLIKAKIPTRYASSQSEGGAADKAVSIPFGQVDSTSTSTAYTATIDGITELRDGICVYLKNGVVTSASGFTININGLGAKPCYSSMAAETRSTTVFNVSYTFLLVYNSSRVEGGCWDIYYGYDSNTNTIGYQLRTNSTTLPMSEKVYRYRLLFTSADGTKWVPANTSTSTNATASRSVNQTKIDPFGKIVYYGYTTAIDAGASPDASYMWTQYVVTLGYSFNKTGAALTLNSFKPVYIKCAPQSDGSAIIDADTPYVQTLPSTADEKIYIFLGIATGATTVEMVPEHPIYCYRNGGVQRWTGLQSEVDAKYTKPASGIPASDLANGVIPSNLSDLNNDAGFITDAGVTSFNGSTGAITYTAPVTSVNGLSGAVTISVPSASSTTPLMDGTAAIGSAVTWAKADHVHPSDTTKVDKVSGKGLSTNDYDATAKEKVDAIPSNPQYTDTVYDDTALSTRVSTIESLESGWNSKQDGPLIGQINDSVAANYLSPTNVFSAINNGIDVYVSYVDRDYGSLQFTSWNVASSMNTIAANIVVVYNSIPLIYTLWGATNTNTWGHNISIIPTSTSDLTNGAGFITASDIPSDLSEYNNDVGFITSSDIPSIPNAYDSNPASLGAATAGISTEWARGDHVHAMPSAIDVGAIPAPASPSNNAVVMYDATNSAWIANVMTVWTGGSY